jgi:DtxR family Mn-dependent transcriptional regulator
MLSQAVEDYLKTIYKLQDGSDIVSTSDIARTMSVSSASVTNMVKRLAQLGLVEYESYRGVTVTSTGKKVALEIIRHHRLLELYLREVMGYPWDKVHQEAEHLEHHISEEFEDKLDEMLGFPTHDPHGDPIPTREGEIAESTTDPLASFEPGVNVVIQRVSDSDPEMLGYLEKIGLLPGTTLEIVAMAPFHGPVTVRVGDSEHVIGYRIASNVFVEPTK